MLVAFDYKVIATVASNRMFAERQDVFDLLSFMTGSPVGPENVNTAMRACASYLRELVPKLAAINVGGCNEYTYQRYLWRFKEILGEMVEIPAGCAPMPSAQKVICPNP